jgi:hypothetical protein
MSLIPKPSLYRAQAVFFFRPFVLAIFAVCLIRETVIFAELLTLVCIENISKQFLK